MATALLFLTFVGLSSLLRSPAASAQTGPTFPWFRGYDVDDVYLEAMGDQSGQNMVKWVGELWVWLLMHISTAIGGPPGGGGAGGGGGWFGFNGGGAVGLVGVALKSVYDAPSPVNNSLYLASINPFTKPVYAAGAGASSLIFILELWQLCRNIAYVGMILVTVIFGVMIMLRRRIDPRTVITVQLALPRIVISLILVTFSYPIAGLIIDISFVAKALILNVLNTLPGFAARDIALIEIWSQFGISGFIDMLKDALDLMIRPPGGGPPAPDFNFLNLGAVTLLGITLNLSLFSVMTTLLIKLIVYYASWFISTALAPFTFLWGAIPGQIDHISGWFKRFFVSVIVFPVTYGALNIALYLKGHIGTPVGGGQNVEDYLPEITLFSAPDPAGGLQSIAGATMAHLLYFGLILAIAKLPEVIEEGLAAREAGRGGGIDISKITRRIPIIGSLMP